MLVLAVYLVIIIKGIYRVQGCLGATNVLSAEIAVW